MIYELFFPQTLHDYSSQSAHDTLSRNVRLGTERVDSGQGQRYYKEFSGAGSFDARSLKKLPWRSDRLHKTGAQSPLHKDLHKNLQVAIQTIIECATPPTQTCDSI